ncbi:MAG: hypothetical protein SFV51_14910 [Bryobacteraceae bacterium]|nr:hypothetical protein [Bryobacteraceae bacterium]
MCFIFSAAIACAQVIELGPAPLAPEGAVIQKNLDEPDRAATGNWFNTDDRAAIRDLYNGTYAPTNDVAMGFTGNVASCNAGGVSQAWLNAVITRINFFRGMAGVPMGVTLNSTFSAKNQQAAMMMSRNQALSHTPPTSWACYNADGAEAAGKSNICMLSGFGNADPGCVAGYIEDAGSNNSAVGHRRWLFYPQTTAMGTGDAAQANPYPRANALWVIDNATFSSPRPGTRDNWVAWPPKGYLPYQLLPARWSFSYPGANFSNANITMTRGGVSVSVTKESLQNGYGENTLVWQPSMARTNPGTDSTVRVTVSNVVISGVAQSFTYDTIIFDPAAGGASTVSVTINTSPQGRTIAVDSVSYTAPRTFTWTTGSQHTISAGSPQTAGATRYVFANWSHGGALTQTITTPAGNTAYTANFNTQHQLSSGVSGSGQIQASPGSGDGFYNAGAAVQLTAVPASGFQFSGWTGALTGQANPQTVVMNAPRSVTASFTGATPAPTSGLRFVPVTPCRVADTRAAASAFGGPAISAGATRTFSIPSGPCPGIPSTALAYSLNLTVVAGGPLGYLTAWPAGQARPLVSALNAPNGGIVANAAIVPAGTGGAINVFVTNTTHLVIDINGYFAAPAAGATLQFYPVTPCRVADTRSGNATFGGPALAAGATRTFPIPSSACGIPSSAAAYSFNVTVVPSGPLGYLTAWPAGAPQPLVSTLNSPTGGIVANAAIVPAGPGGAVNFFATNQTHLVLDINGYFAAPGSGGLSFYPQTPCRVADTRAGQGTSGSLGPPTLAGNTSRAFQFTASSCGIAAGAGAYSVNVTVVPAGPLGFLTIWPTGAAQPLVSTLNSPTGAIVANAAIVPAGTGGAVNTFVTNTTDVVIDINGRFAP